MKKPTRIVPYLSPILKKLKRGPAVTLPKDFGIIAAYTGIGKDSRVVELGCGSGFFTAQAANIAKEVVSYEKRGEFLGIAETNIKKLGFGNVVFKHRDVLGGGGANGGIDEAGEDFDLVFCDIAEAERVVPMALRALRKGGFLAAHCLHVEQAKALVLEAKKFFEDVQMVEALVRDYEVDERGTRPRHAGLMHTAYLVFARK